LISISFRFSHFGTFLLPNFIIGVFFRKTFKVYRNILMTWLGTTSTMNWPRGALVVTPHGYVSYENTKLYVGKDSREA
jgi:hypothetical protein